jgi:hypothetical protein
MRFFIVHFLLIINFYLFSQQINSENFNSSEMNRVLLKSFNEFRKSKGLDTLIYSQTVFDSLSYPNCVEVSSSCGFYHPSITIRWKNKGLRELIVKESFNSVGGDVLRHSSGLPWLDTWENAFRTYGSFTTYEEIAKLAIDSWEKSPSHNRVQNMSFVSGDLPGLFSCHSERGKNGYIYIYINFVTVHRN